MSRGELERVFDLFGSRVRILIGAHPSGRQAETAIAGLRIEALLRRMHVALTRFDPASELSAFNRDPARTVTAGAFVRMLVEAGVNGGDASGGLVDFTQLGSLEDAGYEGSRVGTEPAPLVDALSAAPSRDPATPDPRSAWSQFEVDRATGTVTRPPGERIDGGGLVKGLAADLGAAQLSAFSSFAIDCGGDLSIGGSEGLARIVELANPLRPGQETTFEVTRGGVATSGLSNRIWSGPSGYAHHLINPGTGRPAWTGVVQATALAESARAAEVLAKSALLAGPSSARQVLRPGGGVLVLESGEFEFVGDVVARRSLAAARS